MVKWKFKEKDNCPRCNRPGEDREHIITCQDIRAEEQFNRSTNRVSAWMETTSTDPEIRTAVIQGLYNMRRNPTSEPRIKKTGKRRIPSPKETRIQQYGTRTGITKMGRNPT